jgi:hypothetical protein
MTFIDTDFSDVPNEIPQVEAGTYTCTIAKVGWRDAEEGSKRKASHTFQLKILGDGDGKPCAHDGSILFDDFPPEFLKNKTHAVTIRFVQMLKSAGVSLSGGIDIKSLEGKNVRLVASKRTYIDKTTQETKEQTQVKNYLFTA